MTKNRVLWCLLAVVLTTCGCSAPYPVAVRSFVVNGVHADTTYGAYGYVVLNQQRNSENTNRYGKLCSAYQQSLLSVDSYDGLAESEDMMPTFWPLTTVSESEECDDLLARYDYAFASQVSASVRKQHVGGPVLVALDSPFGVANPKHDPLVFDLSSFSEDEFERFFGIWKGRITRNPEAWNGGFNLVVFREEFRSILLKHGDSILALVK